MEKIKKKKKKKKKIKKERKEKKKKKKKKTNNQTTHKKKKKKKNSLTGFKIMVPVIAFYIGLLHLKCIHPLWKIFKKCTT